LLDSIGVKAWGTISAFLAVTGFVSGAALANGLNQQEHRLMLHRIKMLEDSRKFDGVKLDRIMEKVNAMHARQSEIYLDE
jgi:hypothetical protein